jgi:hypothetical protein
MALSSSLPLPIGLVEMTDHLSDAELYRFLATRSSTKQLFRSPAGRGTSRGSIGSSDESISSTGSGEVRDRLGNR